MITHSTSAPTGAPKYFAIAGKDTLTIDESSVHMNTPVPTMPRTAHLLGFSTQRGVARPVLGYDGPRWAGTSSF